MTPLSNLHTHTVYCDGKNTPEELILRALELGWESIGFSGHSYTKYAEDWCMSPEGERAYRNEILTLREKYRGKLDVYLGLEQDMLSPAPADPYDYIIGSMHYLKLPDGGCCAVDESYEVTAAIIADAFAGDGVAYAQAYYRQAASVAAATHCDIVGHFDLVTKFNEGGRCFDETDPRYQHAAITALRQVAQDCRLFEINTGAMLRAGRTVPYPAAFLLRELHQLGGEVILTSDCHQLEGLDHAFSAAAALAKECGFSAAKILRNGGFENVEL